MILRLYSVEWVYQTETETAFHFRENQALRNQTMTTAQGHYSENKTRACHERKAPYQIFARLKKVKQYKKTTKLRYRTER